MEKGFGIVWLCQGVGSEKQFVAEFKDRLISCYKQNWHSDIESDDRYRWLYSFKCTFEAEKYLLRITSKWLQDMLARFRLRVCGLKKHKQWFPLNKRETLPVQCVARMVKMRHTSYFIVRPIQIYERNTGFLTHLQLIAV